MARRTIGLGEGPSSGELPEWKLEVAAVLEERTHIAGLGWRLTGPDGTVTLRAETRRFGRSRVFSELTALRGGLDEARRRGARRVVVRTADALLPRLLHGGSGAKFRRAQARADALRPLLRPFDAVRFNVGPPSDPELDHAVGESLDAGLHAAAERKEHRQHVIEQIHERARSVHLERRGSDWVANGRYRVSLDPMECECPAWTARWARAPLAGRRAQRLPCKHLVALAIQEGLAVPADLEELARKAPP